MTSLQRFQENGIEILIDTKTGESFASISGYARMSGKDKSTISRRCTVAFGITKTAQIQTESGVKTVSLIPENSIAEWIIDDNPVMAKQLLKAGVRVFLHKTAGFTVTSNAVEPQPQLPPVRDEIDWINALQKLSTIDDPFLKEQLTFLARKHVGLMVAKAQSLPAAIDCPPARRITTVTVRASELGYKIFKDNGTNLGKWVKSRVKSLPESDKVQEGRYLVWAYYCTEELDAAIHAYYTAIKMAKILN